MKLKLQYLWIEVKKALKIFPRMLLQAVLLILLIGAIAFCGVKSMEQNPLAVNVDIAVVVREENMMTKMALSYVEDMESVSQICSFRQMAEDEGFDCLERGEVAALILVNHAGAPGSPFSRAITSGTNDNECHSTNSFFLFPFSPQALYWY